MLSGLVVSAALLVPFAGPPAAGPSQPPAATAPGLLPKSATGPAQPEIAPPPSAAQAPPPAAAPQPVAPPGMAADPAACGIPGGQPEPPSLRDEHLGPPYSVWVEGGFLRYWIKPAPSPVLLAVTAPGGLPAPLIGGRDYEYGPTDGGWVGAGLWLNDRHTIGIGGKAFMLEQRTVFSAANSAPDGTPLLTRPFIDALLAQPAALFVSNPGVLAGGLWTAAGARLSGADAYAVHNIAYCCNYSVDFLAGFKYLDLDEFLAVNQVSRPIGAGVVTFNNAVFPGNGGPALALTDRFRTRNQFYGGTIGFRTEYRLGPAFANLTTIVGMGNNHQVVDIDGTSQVAVPGQPVLPGGLLAVNGANMGREVTNRFAVVCDIGAQAGFQVTRFARLLVGYDFLYLNNVARPGGQIDPTINPRLLTTSTSFRTLTGLTSPIRTDARDDFFAHGVRVGLELQF